MPSEILPPAQPAYVLRGHKTQIHALQFYSRNSRLLTADAEGWLVSWDMAIKRPVAGWRAHDKAILGLAVWGEDTIISHGRDDKLRIWKLDAAAETSMTQWTPADTLPDDGKKPEMLHELTVNTLNFCSFAWCRNPTEAHGVEKSVPQVDETRDEIMVAIPNTLDSDAIDIFHFPSEKRRSTIPAQKDVKTGMAMALSIAARQPSDHWVAVGYESGHVIIFHQPSSSATWSVRYKCQAHIQPILSLCLYPDLSSCISSSADARIAKHPFKSTASSTMVQDKPLKSVQTKHSGQQGLSMRSDGKVFATAGWDCKVRVYSAKTMKELAVLKYHKQGCYATSFAAIQDDNTALRHSITQKSHTGVSDDTQSQGSGAANEGVTPPSAVTSVGYTSRVMARLQHQVEQTHWLAAGSKDGKVSLWDVF